MANLCESLISKAIDFDCDELITRGLESDGIIINRSDIDFSATVFDNTNPNIIKTLVLKTGKVGYDVKQLGNTPFTGTQSTLEVGTYRNTWTHQIPIVVLSNTPEVANKIIDGLANGTFVVILRNKFKGDSGEAEFQVYGYTQGLVASEGTNEKYSEDTDGGWLITLQETGARLSAMFFFNTDATTTAAAYEALKTA
jgi:hypothetical protein